MKKYVDFQLGPNETIRVEVADTAERTTRGPTQTVVEAATLAFEDALAKLKPMCTAIVRQVRDVEQPEEIVVEFGVKLSAEAGVILTSTAAEANLKISMKWKK